MCRTRRQVVPSLLRLLLALAPAVPAGMLGQETRPAYAAAGHLNPTFGSGGSAVSVTSPGCVSPSASCNSGFNALASAALLDWTNPPGTAGLILASIPLDGRPTRYQALAPSATTAIDDTGGVMTCYVLIAGTNAGTSSTYGLVRAMPGVSAFASATGACGDS
jgi:hypothetical protein